MKNFNRNWYSFILLLVSLLTAACNPDALTIEDQDQSSSSPIEKTWSFNDSNLFTFNSEEIAFTDGKAVLQLVDQTVSSDRFDDGEHLSSVTTNGKLTIDASTSTEVELNDNWSPAASSLVLHYQFENNFADTRASFNGTGQGGATFSASSKVGSAAGSFDGADDFVNFSDNDILDPGAITVSAWVKFNASGTDQVIVNKGGDSGYRLRINSTGNLDFLDQGATNQITSDQVLSDGVWHHVAATGSNAGLSLYLDGELIKSNAVAYTAANTGSDFEIGANSGSEFLGGSLDELALWTTALSASDIALVFHRQKQMHSAVYQSPVISVGTSVPWDSMNWSTDLPFLKSLTAAAGAELVSSYQSLTDKNAVSGDSDLSDGLIQYFTFDGSVAAITPSSTITDLSAVGNSGTTSNSTELVSGILGQSLRVNTANGGLNVVSAVDDIDTDEGSVAGWFRRDFPDGDNTVAERYIFEMFGDSNNRIAVFYASSADQFFFRLRGNGTTKQVVVSEADLPAGEWFHIVFSWSIANDQLRLFINGEEHSNSPITGLTALVTPPVNFQILNNPFVNKGWDGTADDFALWTRPLDPSEAIQLYRRGANRLRFQVKTCIDENCNCSAFATNGSSNDCDGDGTPNSQDSSDAFFASFKGSGDDSNAFYSELVNCPTIDANGACDGNPNLNAAQLDFSDFPASGQPANNSYLRVRVLLEAEDNSLCSSSTCFPILNSISFEPNGRRYGGGAIISPNDGISFSSLKNISFTEGGTCTPKYQLSTNGSDFFFWNGSQWASAQESIDQASTSSDISDQIESLTAVSSQGTELFFKAFLPSDSSQTCEIGTITTSVLQ